MKPSYVALQKQIDELEAKLGQKRQPCLSIVVNEGEDQQPLMERAVAEWAAAHPKAKARTVDSFDWIAWVLVKRPPLPGTSLPSPPPSSSSTFDELTDDAARRRFSRRIQYPPGGLN